MSAPTCGSPPKNKAPGAGEQTGRLVKLTRLVEYHAAENRQPLSLHEAQRIAEAALNCAGDWQQGGEHGFFDCPGKQYHTHRNGKKDCRVSLDKVPTINCLHQS